MLNDYDVKLYFPLVPLKENFFLLFPLKLFAFKEMRSISELVHQ